MNEKVTRIVSKIVTGGHNGPYGVIYEYSRITITFSLESPVWDRKHPARPGKGDWVTVWDIRIHGNPPRKRAGCARLATWEEVSRVRKGGIS